MTDPLRAPGSYIPFDVALLGGSENLHELSCRNRFPLGVLWGAWGLWATKRVPEKSHSHGESWVNDWFVLGIFGIFKKP